MDFTKKHCVPCEGGTQPLSKTKVVKYLKAVPGWQVVARYKQIEREYVFKDFVTTIKFINALAKIAQAEGHHPNLSLFNWNHLKVQLSTHAIGGLSDNDFILAARADLLLSRHPAWLKVLTK